MSVNAIFHIYSKMHLHSSPLTQYLIPLKPDFKFLSFCALRIAHMPTVHGGLGNLWRQWRHRIAIICIYDTQTHGKARQSYGRLFPAWRSRGSLWVSCRAPVRTPRTRTGWSELFWPTAAGLQLPETNRRLKFEANTAWRATEWQLGGVRTR